MTYVLLAGRVMIQTITTHADFPAVSITDMLHVKGDQQDGHPVRAVLPHPHTRRLGSHLPPPRCQECSQLRHGAPGTTTGCQL